MEGPHDATPARGLQAGFRAHAHRGAMLPPPWSLRCRFAALAVCSLAAGAVRAADAAAPLAPVARGLELRVVEMPSAQPPGFGPPKRVHHALSFRNEAPKRWLQSIGIDATDCTTRVRFPSHFGPSADGRGLAAEVAAQVHFSCRF
jgi:hypothetical protein